MSEITLEKVDQVIERTYATYAEAKEALEACDGDVVNALIYIEKKREEESKVEEKVMEEKAESFEDIKKFLKDLIDKGNVSRIRILKDEKALTDIPVNAGIAAGAIAVIFPSILALSVVAAIATKITIEITKADGSVEIVNKIVKNAANDIKGKAFGLKEKAFSVANDMKEKRENGKTNENKTNKFHKHNKLENETSFTYTVKFDDVD
ncbi:DUF4342 domain-containing protein [Clostridium perfringens]|uniref:UBA/TS-N domain protein n=1 Tax=Clostridium perfringens (strain SM101 / Type A) TaxID=289380 RepID=Q0SRG3_CLOPS|nr:DUF4342 domain-containing protein [Clostridium perfringens]ABG86749.1 UBA/TS-N domain protein [Clostridium perfringens SM101]EJT5916063.1 DUF4342 domain-containing protein [Clostridium perfringens]EJT5924403.1 DUF4342 domain-containing protein [Clostridium perfringens]EJT6134424.1 DUF4342 domain-containing protein [Clostridium perfringens]EJT6149507.1 DUF4342 domain-containing protein [Clostridium perfringens]